MVKNPDTPLVAATRNQAMNTNHQGRPLGELFLSSLDKFGVWDHLESEPEEKIQSVMEQEPKSGHQVHWEQETSYDIKSKYSFN